MTDRTAAIRARCRTRSSNWCSPSVLVVLVIFVFLRTLPATIDSEHLRAAVADRHARRDVPFGYSHRQPLADGADIATGFVVDDAIVMIENIARYIEEGMTPLEAALKAPGRSASRSSR